MRSDGKANLRYLGLKNSNFSRLAGAAPQAGVAMRLKAGAARLFTVVHDSATAFRITTPRQIAYGIDATAMHDAA